MDSASPVNIARMDQMLAALNTICDIVHSFNSPDETTINLLFGNNHIDLGLEFPKDEARQEYEAFIAQLTKHMATGTLRKSGEI